MIFQDTLEPLQVNDPSNIDGNLIIHFYNKIVNNSISDDEVTDDDPSILFEQVRHNLQDFLNALHVPHDIAPIHIDGKLKLRC